MLPKGYFTFFKGLAADNTREWFEANKKDYESLVKRPFTSFVESLIEAIRIHEPELHVTPKDTIFRINRDIRFSKNKEPYKTSLGAVISPKGRKHEGFPGFYIEAGVKGVGIAGGAYMPDKETLTNIRDLIMHEGAELDRLLAAKSFAGKFGEIRGERNKILPAEFKAAAETYPLIYNKQFFWWADLPASTVTSADAVHNVMAYYEAALPVQTFLRKAFA